ncbi:MAG: hypothetical protein PHP08_00335 [Candidatus Dojkabacteria bacterium]|nr:hypothetical protein [Candidatus Dojkabacteria bacterium]
MNIEFKSLGVEDITNSSIESVEKLYREGYRLNESYNVNEINKQVSVKSLAACPSSLLQNTIKTLTASASSGTPPYTYHWSITKPGGVIDTSLTGSSIPYTFSLLGNYVVSVYVTDSCSSGSKTSNTDSCIINVTPVPGGGYNCISPGNCQPAPSGTTGQYPDLASCDTGCPVIISDCPPECDLTKNYCVAGNCIPKTYVVYAGLGLTAITLLSLLK